MSVATVYLRIPARVSKISASATRAYLSMHGGKTTQHTHTHTRTHFQTGLQHTFTTHDTATNYYYSIITTTATITTIIGCLSIRLTPSSGPNYYVTIFIDNKRRNKYWSNNCNKKEKKKKAKWLLDACPGTSISISLFRDSTSVLLQGIDIIHMFLSSRRQSRRYRSTSIDSLSLFRTKAKKRDEDDILFLLNRFNKLM